MRRLIGIMIRVVALAVGAANSWGQSMRRRVDPSRIQSASLLAVVLCLITCSPVLAQSGKKPKGGGDTEPPQPLYAVSLFEKPEGAYMFSTAQPFINENLQVAGSYYTQNGDGTFYALNTFFYDPAIHAGQAIDLNSVVQGLPAGFSIVHITGLNDRGMLAVSIRPLDNLIPDNVLPSDPTFLALAGLVDTAEGYQFYALPDLESNRVYAKGLNNSNDVVLVDQSVSSTSRTTCIAFFDPTQENWQIGAEHPGFDGDGISERLESGDLFLAGAVDHASGKWVPARINITNPGVGEVILAPVQIDGDTSYSFAAPSAGGVNSWGEFLGRLTSTTVSTRRGKTTTSTVDLTYLCTGSWEELPISDAQSLNDHLDFTAGGLPQAPALLIHRDIAEPINLLSVIETSTAPEIDWANPNLRLTNLVMTNRRVTDDNDPTNDLPVIMGFDQYDLDTPYILNTRYAFMLIPIAQ